MTPYLTDPDVTLHQGDSLEVLRSMPDASVHMAATSPPFFGLRDYQSEGQIGLESSPDEWAARLVDVFREVRRVLRDDGTFWLEIGDSYASNPAKGASGEGKETAYLGETTQTRRPLAGMKPKDLIGQPWLLAFALRADGWYLRSCIIWSKPNAMPESVTDRPTTGHSYVFLLSKKSRYFYDAEALREPNTEGSLLDAARRKHIGKSSGNGETSCGFGGAARVGIVGIGKNARTVWTIPTEPNALAICRICDAYWQGGAPREHCGSPVVQHFAAFPRELVRRMILAGTSERGVCGECGAPWVRETESELHPVQKTFTHTAPRDGFIRNNEGHIPAKQTVTTLGWLPSCKCSGIDTALKNSGGDPTPMVERLVPATVLDPFSGSGTSLLVARSLGRHAVGIELNERYAAMTRARMSQLSLLSELA